MFRQIITLTIIILLSSCIKILDVNVPEVDDQIVVNCVFRPDTNFIVGLERSKGVLEPTVNTNRLPDATIELYGNGVLLETVQVDSFEVEEIIVNFEVVEGIYDEPFPEPAYVALQTRPEQGVEYRLKVSATGYETVEAVSSLPPPMSTPSIAIVDSVGNSYNPDLEIRVEWADNGTVENYYFLRIKERGHPYHREEDGSFVVDEEENYVLSEALLTQNTSFWSRDIVFEDIEFALENFDPEVAGKAYFHNGFAPFSDELFNGQDKSMLFTISPRSSRFNLDSIVTLIEMGTAAPDFFDYYRSAELQYNADGAAFSEPVTLHSNVSNGLGIFAGYTSYTVEIK